MKQKKRLPKHGDQFRLPVTDMEPNDWNPNEMTPAEFDALGENMEEVDFLDPILVTFREWGEDGRPRYLIIDGEHRWDQARLTGLSDLPVIYADPERVPTLQQKKQTVKMNVLHGRPNKRKLLTLVEDVMEEEGKAMEDVAYEMGFVDYDAFQNLIAEARNTLPDEEMKKEFDKAKDELKTVDDLSLLLNKLFTRYGCFPPGTLVSTEYGMRPIEDVTEGDRVFTHKGRLRAVTRVFEREEKSKLVKLKVQKFGEPIFCTLGHEFYQVKGCRRVPTNNKGSFFAPERSKVVKTEAGNLWLDDWLLVPSNKGVLEYPDDAPAELTEEFARFLGLYVAEGFVNKRNSGHEEARFSFGIHEGDYAAFVQSWARRHASGLPSVYEDSSRGTKTVVIRDTAFANWLARECGEGAYNKHVPFWMNSQKGSIIDSFLDGAVQGDGWTGRERIEYSTVSLILAYQIRDLLALRGKAACYVERRVKERKGPRGQLLKAGQIRVISWSKKSKFVQSPILGSSGFGVRITKYDEVPYRGPVFNLEVEEDHSYQVFGVAVGNSTLPCNFMILDFGGKKHIWVRMDPKAYSMAVTAGRDCMEEGYTFDSVMKRMIMLLDVPAFVEEHKKFLEEVPVVGAESIDALVEGGDEAAD